MNWKAEAMEKLRRYEAMERATVNIPLEIQRLKAAAQAPRGAKIDGTPVKGSGNRREEMLMDNMVHRQELQWNLEQAQWWLDTADRALETLTPEERLVLRRLYISPQKGAVERLCQELGVEQSSVYRRRDQALYRFTTALYGFPES